MVKMKNYLLKKLILRFKGGDIQAFSLIYEEFKKMINFYSKKIGDEDACQELIMFLLEVIYNLELGRFRDDESDELKRYMAVAVRNQYIALSKKRVKDLTTLLTLYENDAIYSYDDDLMQLNDMLKTLTEKQRKIIIYKYIYGYSNSEIAKSLGISRQAVGRLENRGFDVIRENFSPKVL